MHLSPDSNLVLGPTATSHGAQPIRGRLRRARGYVTRGLDQSGGALRPEGGVGFGSVPWSYGNVEEVGGGGRGLGGGRGEVCIVV